MRAATLLCCGGGTSIGANTARVGYCAVGIAGPGRRAPATVDHPHDALLRRSTTTVHLTDRRKL